MHDVIEERHIYTLTVFSSLLLFSIKIESSHVNVIHFPLMSVMILVEVMLADVTS